MADESQRPIIVKRIKKAAHGHHGGAWKIAYADFVTAMMAFFLLMWLLGSVSQGTLSGIAEHFRTPLKVALGGGEGAGDATSVIHGGGTDLTRQAGQVKKVPRTQEEVKAEKQRLTSLAQKIQGDLNSNTFLKEYKNQILLEMTPQGLRIQIVDEKNRPMFDSGSSTLLGHTQEILRNLGVSFNALNNHVSISGHTDATPLGNASANYTNWELSADRANAARRALISGGMQSDRIIRVVGLASASPLLPQNVFDPQNRRITLMVLNQEAEEAILKDGGAKFDDTNTDDSSQPIAQSVAP